MTQTWHNLLFAHVPIAPESLLPLVPRGVELDTFEGQAWLGVIAFRLSRIRLRGLPEIGLVSHFNEVNLRTYVTHEGNPGVLFLSMDANNRPAIALARPLFHLPYTPAIIALERTGGGFSFDCERTGGTGKGAQFKATYRPEGEAFRARRGSLEYWLTERYCYYGASRGRTYRCDISHPAWPLQRACASIERNTLAQALGLPAEEVSPVLHYAHKMTAHIWPPRRLR
jgi:uncharacterized protein YqjF (DUF2071 family)